MSIQWRLLALLAGLVLGSGSSAQADAPRPVAPAPALAATGQPFTSSSFTNGRWQLNLGPKGYAIVIDLASNCGSNCPVWTADANWGAKQQSQFPPLTHFYLLLESNGNLSIHCKDRLGKDQNLWTHVRATDDPNATVVLDSAGHLCVVNSQGYTDWENDWTWSKEPYNPAY